MYLTIIECSTVTVTDDQVVKRSRSDELDFEWIHHTSICWIRYGFHSLSAPLIRVFLYEVSDRDFSGVWVQGGKMRP